MSNSATPATAASTSSTMAAGSPAAPNQKRYFDIHATGVGYLNRVRTVAVKGKGNDYLAVDLTALRGEPGKIEYTHFGCRVSGTEAQRVIREELAEPIKAGKKVMVRFKVGDLEPTSFVFKSGKRQGETGLNIRSHLLIIDWAKVDDEYVYRAPARDDKAAQTGEATAQAASAQPAQTQPPSAVAQMTAGVLEGGMSEEEIDAALHEMEAVDA